MRETVGIALRRLGAFAIDWMFIAMWGGMLFAAVVLVFGAPEVRDPWGAEAIGFVSMTVPVTLYYPARYRTNRRYSLLVVHDGGDYLKFAGLDTILDNLIHRFEIPGLVAACVESTNRIEEYAHHPPHAEFLVNELVPQLERDLPLEGGPANRGLMGASFGAVASLSAAWNHPGFFGRLLLQSGSFAFSDIGPHQRDAVFDPVVKFVNAFRSEPNSPAQKIYVSCGVYESLIYENRSLIPLLQAHGMQVRYEEVRDAHNWENWRDRLRSGLSWLFPGPLWMVYD